MACIYFISPHNMTSSSITSWQIDGGIMETVADFILSGSKITADGDCSHEIKRCLVLGREDMTNLDSILKCRDITLPTMAQLVKAVASPVVMYGCESWTIKKAEHLRTDASELWCSRRLLRVPWMAWRFNQSILKKNQSWNIHWKDWCWSWNSNTSWEMLGWKTHKMESRFPGEISITSDMQMTPLLWQKVKRTWKASWWKCKRRVKKFS